MKTKLLILTSVEKLQPNAFGVDASLISISFCPKLVQILFTYQRNFNDLHFP